MRNLYLDIDGVLLGKNDPDDFKIVLVKGAADFLKFCIGSFQCYWLTTHCNDADNASIVSLLRQYADESVMRLVPLIRSTRWKTFKTEAIDFNSDFYWLEDQLLTYEKEILEKNNVIDRWIKVDTRKEPGDLIRVAALLKKRIN